ncbi:MAG: NADH-quinone oxidoreductase subunit A [Syntrophaceae bacterium]|nr:NADH-quinone oxidoreductase subunit A [Syntrophaceae bacterium]
MLDSSLPVLVILLVSIFIGSAIIVLSTILGKRFPTAIKLMPYECGMDPIGGARRRFSVKFFIIGMLFIVFDIELIFLFPWAKIYDKLMFFGFVEMLLFVVILLAGLIYVWKKGALQWE